MKNTFINKVAAERAVLRIVNANTPGSRQLSGLSWGAIDNWQRSNNIAHNQTIVDELKKISDLCQRLSDRSHETFPVLDPSLNATIESGMEALTRLLEMKNNQ